MRESNYLELVYKNTYIMQNVVMISYRRHHSSAKVTKKSETKWVKLAEILILWPKNQKITHCIDKSCQGRLSIECTSYGEVLQKFCL